MVNTKKFSEFSTPSLNDSSTEYVGLASGVNVRQPRQLEWTTAGRPSSPYNGLSGYNLDLDQWEYWNEPLLDWVQFTSGSVGVTQIDTGTGLTGGPITTTGLISFASIAAMSLWANTTAGSAVPTVTPLSTFLLSANNLSDVPSKPTARTNLGLAIGTNVEAWSPLLDQIAAGTWPGDTSITTLGTITTGVWHGAIVGVTWGGTGNNSFTAYSVICAGTTSTGAFQNVSGVGTLGQVLTSQGPGMLPIWSNTSGSGTVNSGTANQLAYYASNGTTVSGLATANDGVLVTDGSGVPSISNTLPTIVQGNITSLGTITSGVWNATEVDVAHGGIGVTSLATYAVLCGGTSATGDVQQVSGLGLLGQVLTSQGPGALPIWSNAPGTGTVDSAAINNIAYYPANGNTVDGFATANGGVLVTSNTGVPSILAGSGVTGNILMATAGGTPAWSNAVYPTSTTNNQILFSNNTNTITGLATGNNSVLVTNGGGVPSLSTTLPSGLTIPGYALSGANSDITSLTGLTGVIQAPTAIRDANGNNILAFASVASAVNYFTFSNTATGSGLAITPSGTDGSIPVTFYNKNSLFFFKDNTNTNDAIITLINAAGTQSCAIAPHLALTGSFVFRLPGSTGAAGSLITTNGSDQWDYTTLGQIKGEPSNANASAGNMGEYIKNNVLTGSAVAVTTGIAKDITSISLTAGDWDVWGEGVSKPGAGTTTSAFNFAISTTSNTLPTLGDDTRGYAAMNVSIPANGTVAVAVPTCRISLSATTTVYLVTSLTFGVSTMAAYGYIAARRAR